MGDKLLDQRLVLVGVSGAAKQIFLVGGPGNSTRSCLSTVCDVVSDLDLENMFSQKDLDGDITDTSQAIVIM